MRGRMRQFTNDERRRRIARRHHLATKATDVATVARALIGLHGTDPVTIFLSARARMKKATVEGIEAALYDDRTIVRMLAMRRTLFVVPVDLVPMVQVAASDAVAANEHKRLVRLIDEAGWTADASRWLTKANKNALAALEALGSATAAEIVARVPELRRTVMVAPQSKWGTEQAVGLRVVPLLGAQGHIARARPKGSWISTQHRWEPMTHWVGDDVERPALADARAELVTRWLRAFGPAPVSDLKWWTGWTLGQTRTALGRADVVEVEIDGRPAVALTDDFDDTKPVAPRADLLPGLDPTVMGWQERTWFMGEHAPKIFDRAGNAGATVWWDGHVVGVWSQLSTGQIVWKVFEDVGADALRAIEKEAAQLQAWLGSTRFTPRFGPRWVDD